jgi:hypothetical protein
VKTYLFALIMLVALLGCGSEPVPEPAGGSLQGLQIDFAQLPEDARDVDILVVGGSGNVTVCGSADPSHCVIASFTEGKLPIVEVSSTEEELQ